LLSRRRFVSSLATAVPLLVLVRRAHALSVEALATEPRVLRALAEVVLPAELGDDGIERATRAFQEWIAGYRAGAELVHGYGTSRLRFSGPTPATRWSAQLDALETSARRRHGASFADLAREPRLTLVREELATDRMERLPSVAQARHVALALLAHFYDSPAATDLCYEARIARNACRPLAESPRRPVPLARRRGA